MHINTRSYTSRVTRVYSLAKVISRNSLAPFPRTAILIIPHGFETQEYGELAGINVECGIHAFSDEC